MLPGGLQCHRSRPACALKRSVETSDRSVEALTCRVLAADARGGFGSSYSFAARHWEWDGLGWWGGRSIRPWCGGRDRDYACLVSPTQTKPASDARSGLRKSDGTGHRGAAGPLRTWVLCVANSSLRTAIRFWLHPVSFSIKHHSIRQLASCARLIARRLHRVWPLSDFLLNVFNRTSKRYHSAIARTTAVFTNFNYLT